MLQTSVLIEAKVARLLLAKRKKKMMILKDMFAKLF